VWIFHSSAVLCSNVYPVYTDKVRNPKNFK
jgi:hypothetical protein